MTIGRRGGNASLKAGAPQGVLFAGVENETDGLRSRWDARSSVLIDQDILGSGSRPPPPVIDLAHRARCTCFCRS